MLSFLKKDILVLIRDKSELMTLLLMPFILIGILGFALQGLLDGNIGNLHMSVALVQEDKEEEGVEKFVEDLHDAGLAIEEIAVMQAIASEANPVLLLEQLFSHDELKELIEIKKMGALEADEAIKNEDIVAILTIPEGFSYESLQKAILGIGEGSSLEITSSSASSFYTNIFTDIIDGFIQSYNFEMAIASSVGGERSVENVVIEDLGGIETLTKMEPVSSFQYYTIGMAVMFVLFVGGTIASKAYVEKAQHTFDRILLSGQGPSAYLTGKGISTTMIAFMQLMILFLLSSIIFGAFEMNDLSFWLGISLISLVLSICVGCIAIFLTALSLRFNSEAIGAIFSGGIVTLFAFVGGSFFPFDNMPEVFVTIGDWTPNGAALSAYIQWIQGYEVKTFIQPFTRMLIPAVLLLIASLFIFPKGRSV